MFFLLDELPSNGLLEFEKASASSLGFSVYRSMRYTNFFLKLLQ